MNVIKRDGSRESFNIEKILNAVEKAYKANGWEKTETSVKNRLITAFDEVKNDTLTVENIQDIVETVLMAYAPKNISKSYILYREKHSESRFIRERLDYMEKYSTSTDNAATSSETDANANVTIKNVANLEGEVYKTTNRIIQRQRMKDKLNEMFPEVAKQYEEDLENHIIYVHDEASTPVLKQYCMAVSLYPLMMNGVGNIDGITPTAPNDLQSFSGQITNLTFLLSSQCKGAVAFSEYFIALNYYIIKEYGTNWYHILDYSTSSDITCQKHRTVRDQIHKAFKQFIYGINQPAGNRSYQSPLRRLVI